MDNNDINIIVIDRDGNENKLEVPTDMAMNLMEVCKSAELGVEGTCGGMALCASCQVYVESNHELHPPTDDELDMLDQAFFVKSNSRLGCQIKIAKELDGLIVKIAPKSDV